MIGEFNYDKYFKNILKALVVISILQLFILLLNIVFLTSKNNTSNLSFESTNTITNQVINNYFIRENVEKYQKYSITVSNYFEKIKIYKKEITNIKTKLEKISNEIYLYNISNFLNKD